MIKSLFKNKLGWETDGKFRYQIVTKNTSPIDTVFTNPIELYQKSGEIEEYKETKTKLIHKRKEFLLNFEYLNKRIIQAK